MTQTFLLKLDITTQLETDERTGSEASDNGIYWFKLLKIFIFSI